MTPEQISRLTDIIIQKGWEAYDYVAHPEFSTVDAISRMLEKLSAIEIDLSLDLLDDYLIIKDYTKHAKHLLKLIEDSSDGNAVFITPLIEYGAERTKSGQYFHYEMSNFSGIFKKSKVFFRDDPKSPECQAHTGMHVSVDDYIGTGTQFGTMVDNIINDGKNNNITHIATICIQEEAKLKLESSGYKVLSINVLGKGLERLSSRRGVQKAEVLSEYEPIARKTLCSASYMFGRDDAEALVTMKATPNNTLPIFWIEGKAQWPAPFPRPRR